MSPFYDSFGGAMFTIIPFIVTIGFIITFGLVIYNFVIGIRKWQYNNSQPVLKVSAKVVSRRINVSRSSSFDSNDTSHLTEHAYTNYYVTFEVETGSRMEFNVKGDEYGLLMEGDSGKLTFQGTRYLGYERNLS